MVINEVVYKGEMFIGSTFEFSKSALGFCQKLKKKFSDYDLVTTKVGGKTFRIILNPNLAERILLEHRQDVYKGFAYNALKSFLGDGLLTSEGVFWENQRLKNQTFYNKSSINNFVSTVFDEVKYHYSKLKEKEVYDSKSFFNKVAASIVCKILFSESLPNGFEEQKISSSLITLSKYANDKLKNPLKAPLWMPSKQNINFKKALAYIDELIYQLINKRINKKTDHKDLLNFFLSEYNYEPSFEELKLIRDEMVTAFIAGQETTATTMSFALFLLNKNPRILKKLKEEADNYITITSFEDLKLLPFSWNVAQEVMRLYPPAWAISRQINLNFDLNGVLFNKDDVVFIPFYLYHHDQQFWNNSDEFIPERFHGFKSSPYYAPFGKGNRMCIGSHLAQIELQIMLLEWVKCFKFQIRNTTVKLKTPITLSTEQALMINILERD